MDSQTREKIQEIRIIEHNFQQLLMQKQAIDLELNETVNALHEINNSKDKEVYRVLGSIMLKATASKVASELDEKKKLLELRVKSLEKQEKLLEEKGKELHEQIKNSIKSEEDK